MCGPDVASIIPDRTHPVPPVQHTGRCGSLPATGASLGIVYHFLPRYILSYSLSRNHIQYSNSLQFVLLLMGQNCNLQRLILSTGSFQQIPLSTALDDMLHNLLDFSLRMEQEIFSMRITKKRNANTICELDGPD